MMWISAGGAVFLGVYEWAVHGLTSAWAIDRWVSAPFHQLFTTLLFTASSCGVAIDSTLLFYATWSAQYTAPFPWSSSMKKLPKTRGWAASSLPLEQRPFLLSKDTVKLYLSVIDQMHLMIKFRYACLNLPTSLQNLVDNDRSRDQGIVYWLDKKYTCASEGGVSVLILLRPFFFKVQRPP